LSERREGRGGGEDGGSDVATTRRKKENFSSAERDEEDTKRDETHGLTFPDELVLLLSMVEGRSDVLRVEAPEVVKLGGPMEQDEDEAAEVVVVMVVTLEEREVEEVVDVRRAEGPT